MITMHLPIGSLIHLTTFQHTWLDYKCNNIIKIAILPCIHQVVSAMAFLCLVHDVCTRSLAGM